MRQAGDAHQALLQAADRLATPAQGPTLRELAAAAGLPVHRARWTVKDMRRAGKLRIVGTRAVDYRPVPVAEYGPAKRSHEHSADPLWLCMHRWAAA